MAEGLCCSVCWVIGLWILILQSTLGWTEVESENDYLIEARRLCSQLTLDEKISLVHGVEGPYIGNVPGIDRLGIPPITMNDGPQGFRGISGTSTAWPCALSMAATWDKNLTYEWGKAMAVEFSLKGSNVFLGPGVNVARVPQNGRNFEYISGEDPVLGAKLVSTEIQGIQSQGVIANVKHYVQNNQETARSKVDQIVDERTHWELYMPPFEAAINAGVLSFMCSYNKVNGDYACENHDTLTRDLKETLGFKGFVVSDWHGTHSTEKAANTGLDMEMPDSKYFGAELQKSIHKGHVSMDMLNDKIVRILYALIASGAMGRTAPTGSIDAVVTSDAHNRLSRDFAAAGIVLLKNENKFLPLTSWKKTILVIGDIIATGGGSGNVIPAYVVSGYQGIENQCKGTDSVAIYSPIENPDYGIVKDADVVVIFTSTTSTEGSDRPNLSFPSNELQVIEKVMSMASEKLVIIGTAPGAVLTPFVHNVTAMLLSFHPGQEGGNAIADVLFGAVNPSGKLPLTLPNVDNEVGFTKHQYPGVRFKARYTEKLLVGYRWYDASHVRPQFAFGFGLSYTDFAFSDLAIVGRTVSFTVSNSGDTHGHEVCQLYLTFPAETAGEPPKQLKHFDKVHLEIRQSETVSFSLSDRDLSIWDTVTHSWKLIGGVFTIYVGGSLDNLPLQGTLENSQSDLDEQ
jgi:beta-glucosidase